MRHSAHAEILAILSVDGLTGLMTIKASGTSDEIGHIERKETLTIETTWISLRQHKGLGYPALGIDMAEIRPCEEAVVATRTKHHPARVGTPIVERLCIFRVCTCHGPALSCREVEQIEVGLMMPYTELSVVGERIAKEAPVVGRTREGYRFVLRLGIDDDIYLAAEAAR